VGFWVWWREQDRLLEGGHGLLEATADVEQVAAIVVRLPGLRIKRDRPLVSLERLIEAAKFPQSGAAIVDGGNVIGFECE
jgi:hypothetical protein